MGISRPSDDPKSAGPKSAGPDPDAPEPDAPEPDAPEPDAPEPDAPEPDAPEPDAPEPDAPEPDDGVLPPCGDFDMRIARDGTWYYRGTPILRKPLVKLFSTVLRRDEAGDHWLVTPAERGRILVDDAPFTAVECIAEGAGRDQVLRFRTNLDHWVEAGPGHAIRVEHAPDTAEPSPYIEVMDRLDALIVRSVFYQLVELAVERRLDGEDCLGLWSKGSFFPLGPRP